MKMRAQMMRGTIRIVRVPERVLYNAATIPALVPVGRAVILAHQIPKRPDRNVTYPQAD